MDGHVRMPDSRPQIVSLSDLLFFRRYCRYQYLVTLIDLVEGRLVA